MVWKPNALGKGNTHHSTSSVLCSKPYFLFTCTVLVIVKSSLYELRKGKVSVTSKKPEHERDCESIKRKGMNVIESMKWKTMKKDFESMKWKRTEGTLLTGAT